MFKTPINNWSSFFENKDIEQLLVNIYSKYKKVTQESIVYPKFDDIFRAYELTDIDNIKVVLLGQDPYHNKYQAMGLSFSVPRGIKVPPSLRNIYKEMNINTKNGDLTPWAEQGVFLLNSILTVSHKSPSSHKDFGWEDFTDKTLKYISDNKSNVVFILLGSYAISKEKFLDAEKHKILKTTHPSPFSAHRGFIGSNVFGLANDYLAKKINWNSVEDNISI